MDMWHQSGWGRKERGFALIITLLIVLLLVVLVFETDFQARTDLKAAGNFRDDQAAYYLAISGIESGKAILKDDQDGKTNKDSGQSDYEGELWSIPAPQYPLGEGTLSGQIKDEMGKFNLNSLIIQPQGRKESIIESNKADQLKQLLRLLEISEGETNTIVESIVDWMDTETSTQRDGAEEYYYRSLEPPYDPPNDRISTLEEILFIKGVSPEIYKKIFPYITVYPKAPSEFSGTAVLTYKINVNTADTLVLQSIKINDDLYVTEGEAEKIIQDRPYTKLEELHKTLDPLFGANSNKVKEGLSVNSAIFSIESYGAVRGTEKNIRAIWDRRNKQLLYLKSE
jgi:general secretion pathway protein K